MAERNPTAEVAAAERAVIERAAAGDAAAFEELVMRYQDRVYGLALRLVRRPDEAEDVAQEAFVKAYRALNAFAGRSAFYTWLFRITFNVAQSRLRSLGRLHAREKVAPVGPAGSDWSGDEDDPPGFDAVDPGPGPAEAVEAKDSSARVRLAVEALDPESRAVVLLREIDGMSYAEIAEATGASRAAVKSRLHRARRELAGTLKDVLQ